MTKASKIFAASALVAFAAGCSAAFAAPAPATATPSGGVQSAPADVRAGGLPLALWPTGPAFRETEEGEAIFKRTQQQQLDHMWDQTRP